MVPIYRKKGGKKISFFRRVSRKFACAFNGMGIAISTDNSFKAHIFFSIVTIVSGFFFHFTTLEWALALGAIGLVFVSELFNTAIEYLVRMFTTEYHELAGKLLDISAGAVLFSALTAIGIGLLILIPKIINYFHLGS